MYIYRGIFKNRAKKPTASHIRRSMYLKTTTEKLKLHRALSFIVYLTPEWNPDWGGALGFYDFKNNNLVNAIDCVFNRAVIWQYHKLGFHGYKEPLTCPEDLQRTTFRLFYYTSDSQYKTDDMPHRSLYWVDPVTTQPYDKRDQK